MKNNNNVKNGLLPWLAIAPMRINGGPKTWLLASNNSWSSRTLRARATFPLLQINQAFNATHDRGHGLAYPTVLKDTFRFAANSRLTQTTESSIRHPGAFTDDPLVTRIYPLCKHQKLLFVLCFKKTLKNQMLIPVCPLWKKHDFRLTRFSR